MVEKYKYVPIECSIVFFKDDAIRTSGTEGVDRPFISGNDYGYGDVYGD